jgi:hypothetical protein
MILKNEACKNKKACCAVGGACRYAEGEVPFIGIDLDISDSGREGCAVSTLTVSSEPADWEGATAVAIQEVRRLQRHGLTPGVYDWKRLSKENG